MAVVTLQCLTPPTSLPILPPPPPPVTIIPMLEYLCHQLSPTLQHITSHLQVHPTLDTILQDDLTAVNPLLMNCFYEFDIILTTLFMRTLPSKSPELKHLPAKMNWQRRCWRMWTILSNNSCKHLLSIQIIISLWHEKAVLSKFGPKSTRKTTKILTRNSVCTVLI